jgi:nucleoside-diphosphate-sugar epimerase
MKVLIVGGASTVGRALLPVLARTGQVLTAGRHDCDLTLDVSRDFALEAFPADVDVVIHAAAHFGGTTADALAAATETNVVGTLRVCRAAQARGVKHLIYISSVHARFAERSEVPTAYSLTKKQGEEVALSFCTERKLAVTVLRPTQLYGVGETFRRHQPFFYAMLDRAQKNEDIVLYGKRDPVRNYLHVDDLAVTIAKVVEQGVEGTYSCQYPEDVTYARIAKAALSAFGSTARVRFLEDKPDIVDNVFALETSLYDKIGRAPQITIEAGVAQVAAHMQQEIER